ncbi:MAG: SoxR reducing system RseC family protein [Spirochaetaceae bacterium]|nr:SoxR reducing system RseC family protein [Spirochaetaceae bacterium]
MREAGQVLEIKGPEVRVLGRAPEDACFGCMNMECKGHNHVFTALNPHKFPLKAGDCVELEIQRGAGLLEAGLSLFIPLLAFIALYGLSPLLFPGIGAMRTVLGFIALLAAALGVILFRKINPPGRLPRVVGAEGRNDAVSNMLPGKNGSIEGV